MSFVAIGDSGTGSTEQQQIAAMLAGEKFDFALHGGDIAYGKSGGTGAATYQTMDDWFFSMYSGWLRSRPMFPSIGNHDSRPPMVTAVRISISSCCRRTAPRRPTPITRSATTASTTVPCTSSCSTPSSRSRIRASQRRRSRGSQADLAATTQPWKVALFHRSPYSAGGEHGSDLAVRDAFGAVFDQHGVQLVISAHEHDYERTVPMRGGAPAPGGTTYIVTGGGGAPLYPAATETGRRTPRPCITT